MSRVTKISGAALLTLGVLAALAQAAEKPPTELYVRTNPPGAKIFVDSEARGVSPNLFEIEPGKHAITVKLEGYEPKVKDVQIRDGRIMRVVLELKKERQPTRAPKAWKGLGTRKWFDVLTPVDLDRDRVSGRWERDRGQLLTMGGWHAKLMLPVQVEGSYDIMVEFTRLAVLGSRSVNIIFPVGQRRCGLVLGGWHESVHGLQMIDGREPTDERNPATTRPGTLANGHRYSVLIAVRTQGDNASIEVSLDGKRLINWIGKQASLDVPDHWKAPAPKRIVLGANNCSVRFHTVRLRLVSGKALLRPPVKEMQAHGANVEALIGQTRAQARILQAALNAYRLDLSSYPTTDQGFAALREPPRDLPNRDKWNGPYLSKPVPADLWGHLYRYRAPGKHHPDAFDLWSVGPDGIDGTEDDIGNW